MQDSLQRALQGETETRVARSPPTANYTPALSQQEGLKTTGRGNMWASAAHHPLVLLQKVVFNCMCVLEDSQSKSEVICVLALTLKCKLQVTFFTKITQCAY